jgi:hypothetical protein
MTGEPWSYHAAGNAVDTTPLVRMLRRGAVDEDTAAFVERTLLRLRRTIDDLYDHLYRDVAFDRNADVRQRTIERTIRRLEEIRDEAAEIRRRWEEGDR